MKRRAFVKTIGGAVGGGLAFEATAADAPLPEAERVAGLPRRRLGRGGPSLSTVGFPGLALIHYDQRESTAGLRKALDRGVNYFDVAPAYGKGECETKMGIGLQGIDRSRYFLACKTKVRDKAGARAELERSLGLLKTDHFDLYQLHHLRRVEEVEQALGPGGAIETLLEAKKAGKVKYLGFSAHTTRAALAAMKGFAFDTVMFPIDFVELLKHGFGREVLDLARQQGASVLAIKAMSKGLWPKDVARTRKWWYRSVEEAAEVDLAIRFALSQANVVAAIPPSFLDLLDKAIDAAGRFQPITAAEVERLRQIADSCTSVFQREETQVTRLHPPRGRMFPDCPHECGGEWA